MRLRPVVRGPRRVAEDVYALSRRGVNVFFVLGRREVLLVDTGPPGSALAIAEAVQELGRRTDEIKHVVLTHLHGDHTGSAAALRRMVPARFYAHPADAALLARGEARRRLTPAGVRGVALTPLLAASPQHVEPIEVDQAVTDGEELPVAGGLGVLHTPGHTAGHVSLVLPEHAVVFAGDAAANLLRPGLAPFNEDEPLARASLRRLVDAASGHAAVAFGHGREATPAGLAAA